MTLGNDAKFTPFDMKRVDAEHVKLHNLHSKGVLTIVIALSQSGR
jgi:hypothetical protein